VRLTVLTTYTNLKEFTMRYYFLNNNGQVDTKVFATRQGAKSWFARNGVWLWSTELDKVQEFLDLEVVA
jgi:hypothetical protein